MRCVLPAFCENTLIGVIGAAAVSSPFASRSKYTCWIIICWYGSSLVLITDMLHFFQHFLVCARDCRQSVDFLFNFRHGAVVVL